MNRSNCTTVAGLTRFNRARPDPSLMLYPLAGTPISVRNAFNSSRPASTLPILRRAFPTARRSSSACRFWLTLAVMRRSSISGAETRFASSTPVRRLPPERPA